MNSNPILNNSQYIFSWPLDNYYILLITSYEFDYLFHISIEK